MEDKNIQIQKEAKEPISNLNDLVNIFYQSESYKQAFDRFFEKKELAPDVTEEEKKAVFLNQEAGKYAFFDFVQKEQPYSYDDQNYPQDVREAVRDYIAIVKDIIYKERYLDKDEILAFDRERSRRHDLLAKRFYEAGLVPSLKIGRAIGRLILIESKLDKWENAWVPDQQQAFAL